MSEKTAAESAADPLLKPYNPADVEPRWYDVWEERGYFKPQGNGTPYTIMIPPPNVTGSLHVGHALNNTLQDVLVRWKRMDGHRVLWQPGTDHAGIATQVVVEKLIKKTEKKTRHDIGRDAFLERVWAWKEESGGTITRQLRRLGASCDWSRERFTMDDGLSRAVKHAFVQLHAKGLLERDLALINWCPSCLTALSDLEVEHEDQAGKLYHIKYPVQGGGGESITVATTRPETMLGDTGVAVNPDDERYTALLARKAKIELPLTGRVIPLIADAYVDKEFGSGAVKMTPAHDPNDFEVGKRHKLETISIFDDRAKVNANGGVYAGLDRFDARKKVLEDLEAAGLLVKVEDHAMSVGRCQRSNTIVEPKLSKQWFVRTKKLAEPAMAAVRSGQTRFVPENWAKTYFEWMENIRDWCVSRQLWWGHQIPAWYCQKCDPEKPIVALEEPSKCPGCGAGKDQLVRDPDVLDTWFSSGTWPFSTLGWPDQTPELATHYPTSTLVTAFDIIFFWVARMMMFGIEFTGQPPFKDVYIHALVRDAKGEKMSKTRGNVLDPLILMDKFGTDAMRFTLVAFAAQGRDIRLSEERIEGYRNFCNKLWNASRFLLTKIPAGGLPAGPLGTTLADRWILSRLQAATEDVRKALEEYKFNEAANALYQFAWGELCDWYIEITKPLLYSEDPARAAARDATLHTAVHVLDQLFRLLHPIMPFLTEEIWQKLPIQHDAKSLMVARFPRHDPARVDAAAEREMGIVQQAITAIRNVRGEMGLSQGTKFDPVAMTDDAAVTALLERERETIMALSNLATFSVQKRSAPPKTAATAVIPGAELFIPLKGIVDIGAEKARLEKELLKVARDVDVVSGKLSNESYVAKAPPEVVEKDRARLRELEETRAKLQAGMARVAELQS